MGKTICVGTHIENPKTKRSIVVTAAHCVYHSKNKPSLVTFELIDEFTEKASKSIKMRLPLTLNIHNSIVFILIKIEIE